MRDESQNRASLCFKLAEAIHKRPADKIMKMLSSIYLEEILTNNNQCKHLIALAISHRFPEILSMTLTNTTITI